MTNPLGFEFQFDPPDLWVRDRIVTLVPRRDVRQRTNGDLWVHPRQAALVRSLVPVLEPHDAETAEALAGAVGQGVMW